MNKICTSIEQSRKLIELGIDRKTSDMYYWCGSDLRIGGYRAQDEELDIPCWSLAALLDILHNYQLQTQDDGIGILCSCNGKFNIVTADNPVDACVELIIKLKEQNLI